MWEGKHGNELERELEVNCGRIGARKVLKNKYMIKTLEN